MPGAGQALYMSVSGLRLCDGSLLVSGSVVSRRWPALPDVVYGAAWASAPRKFWLRMLCIC